MKLHTLALRLLTALSAISAMTSTAQASYTVTIVIYENFLWNSFDLNTVNGIRLGDTESVGIELPHDYHITDYTPEERDPLTGTLIQRRPTWNENTHFIHGGSVEFHSSSGSKLSFTDGYSTPFSYQSNLSFNNLGGLKFDSLTETDYHMYNGGAIELRASGDLTISNVRDNNSETADVVFSNIQIQSDTTDNYVAASAIGSTDVGGDGSPSIIDISSNGDVSFLNNTGEATINSVTTLSITANEDVLFHGNTNTEYLISARYIKINDNKSVSFIDNTSGTLSSLYGIEINGNGEITFSGNSATTSYGASSGAIYAGSSGDVTFEGNGDITFNGNTSKSNGGAICVQAGRDVTFEGNGNITFNGNTSKSAGGAISGTTTFEGNGDITFNGNTTKSYGGAIWGGTTFSNNGDISFLNNTATGGTGGSAIYSTATLNMTGNDNIVVQGNISNSATAAHGALYKDNGTGLNISENESVSFIGNKVISEKANTVYAGAISTNTSSEPTLQICNNGQVEFKENGAVSQNESASIYAGAIYSHRASSGSKILIIAGNESVTFEKNYRYWNADGTNTLKLRSLHTTGVLNLSAKTGGHITFNDSFYSASEANLNADYVDANGVTQKATGDIILSGKYTEQHLNDILTAEGANRTATESEITASRTSTLSYGATLYGGSLQVKDSAILNANSNLTVAADSKAKIVVSNNAELNTKKSLVLEENSHATLQVQGGVVTAGTSSSYGIDIKTGTLMLSDRAFISAYDINIEEGATLSLSEAATGGLSTYSAESVEDTLIFNQSTAAEVSAILNIAGGATLIADGGNLDMTGHTVTLAVTQNTEKINLQLTRGAGYEEDSLVLLFTNTGNVKFSFDNVTGKTSGEELTLMAFDYFSGEWINEDTKLIYNGGNVYLQGVNDVTVPEPATATLSLLALAGLAARRRRK